MREIKATYFITGDISLHFTINVAHHNDLQYDSVLHTSVTDLIVNAPQCLAVGHERIQSSETS